MDLSYKVVLTFLSSWETKPCNLSGSHVIQGRVRSNEVVEEDEHSYEVVGRLKRVKTLFGLVPRLELLVKCLDQVIGDIVLKGLYADMCGAQHRFNRLLVSGIAVWNDRPGSSHMFDGIKQWEGLRRAPPGWQVESKYKAGFRVNYEPDIVLNAADFNNSFVSVPFIWVEIKCGYKLKGDIMEQRRKVFAPVGNGGMWNLDIVEQSKHKCDLSKRVIANIEHC